jgi:hypothetical protein
MESRGPTHDDMSGPCWRCQKEFPVAELTPHGRVVELLIGWFERLVVTERGFHIEKGPARFCGSCHGRMTLIFGTCGAIFLMVVSCAALSLIAEWLGWEPP